MTTGTPIPDDYETRHHLGRDTVLIGVHGRTRADGDAGNTVAASAFGVVVDVLEFDGYGYALVQHLWGSPKWITLEHTRVMVQS